MSMITDLTSHYYEMFYNTNQFLHIFFKAYKEWEKKNGPEQPLPLLNMSQDQTFFMAFAQVNFIFF